MSYNANSSRYPNGIYIYGSSGIKSRRNLLQHYGEDFPELVHVLSRGHEKGMKCIRIGKPTQKRGSIESRTELALSNPSMKIFHPELIHEDPKSGKKRFPENVSNIYEPDPNRPGEGYGDIQGTNHVFLSRRTIQTEGLQIFVFKDRKGQGAVLFQAWGAGGVIEALASNKLYFTPLFANGGNHD
ncbi:MAG: hypothetical protein MI717_00665 [Spirochaetales bacterium]|nr:hypothetical protein [Spirochaetales bacterium]